MMFFTVAVSDLQFVGHGLARPECVVATARGDVFVSDRRGGIMHLMPGGGQRLVAARGVEGFVPNASRCCRIAPSPWPISGTWAAPGGCCRPAS
jgi:gluconolactonase